MCARATPRYFLPFLSVAQVRPEVLMAQHAQFLLQKSLCMWHPSAGRCLSAVGVRGLVHVRQWLGTVLSICSDTAGIRVGGGQNSSLFEHPSICGSFTPQQQLRLLKHLQQEAHAVFGVASLPALEPQASGCGAGGAQCPEQLCSSWAAFSAACGSS